jgi:hypothetical protein
MRKSLENGADNSPPYTQQAQAVDSAHLSGASHPPPPHLKNEAVVMRQVISNEYKIQLTNFFLNINLRSELWYSKLLEFAQEKILP